MISLFLNRIYRSIKIDPGVFDEIQKDKKATPSAAILVLLTTIGVLIALYLVSGSRSIIFSGSALFIFGSIIALVMWIISSYIIYFIGVKMFPDKKTNISFVSLLNVLGFAYAPALIRVFSFTENLFKVLWVGSWFWVFACSAVAIKQCLNYKNLSKAFAVLIASLFIQSLPILYLILRTK